MRDEVENRLVGVAINKVSKLVAGDVAAPSEIDHAMKLGAGFSDGPTQLTASIGYDRLHETLADLYDETGEQRYEPTSLLAEWTKTGDPA